MDDLEFVMSSISHGASSRIELNNIIHYLVVINILLVTIAICICNN